VKKEKKRDKPKKIGGKQRRRISPTSKMIMKKSYLL